MNNELKPCPFCGSTNLSKNAKSIDGRSYVFVSCNKCFGSGPMYAMRQKTRITDEENPAIKGWNRRAEVTP